TMLRLIFCFLTSFIVGVLGADLFGSMLAAWTGYNDKPLDALGAVIVSAITIKALTFINVQGLDSLLDVLSRLRGGGKDGDK
ncbi:putative prophage membrane protein, partial [Trabulsiella guamensis ATCC 49490]